MGKYRKILGVNEYANIDEIKQAFRIKAKIFHPDINKEKDANEKFRVLNEAYEKLLSGEEPPLDKEEFKNTKEEYTNDDKGNLKLWYLVEGKNNSYSLISNDGVLIIPSEFAEKGCEIYVMIWGSIGGKKLFVPKNAKSGWSLNCKFENPGRNIKLVLNVV